MHRGFMNLFPDGISFTPAGQTNQPQKIEGDDKQNGQTQQTQNTVTTESVFSRYDTDGGAGKGNGSVNYQEAKAGNLVSVFSQNGTNMLNAVSLKNSEGVSAEQLNGLKKAAIAKLGGDLTSKFTSMIGNFTSNTGSKEVTYKEGDNNAQQLKNSAAQELDQKAVSDWANKSNSVNAEIVKQYQEALESAYQDAKDSGLLGSVNNGEDPTEALNSKDANPIDKSGEDAKGEVKEVKVYANLDGDQDKHVKYGEAQSEFSGGMNIKADIGLDQNSAAYETVSRYLNDNFNGQQMYDDAVSKFDFKSGVEKVKDESQVQTKQTEMNTKVTNAIKKEIKSVNDSISNKFQKAVNIAMKDIQKDGTIESHDKKGLSDNANGVSYVNGGQMKDAGDGKVQVFSKYDNNSDGTANIKDGGVKQLFEKSGPKISDIRLETNIAGADAAKVEEFTKDFDLQKAFDGALAQFSSRSSATPGKADAQDTINKLNNQIESNVKGFNVNEKVNAAFAAAVNNNDSLKAEVPANPESAPNPTTPEPAPEHAPEPAPEPVTPKATPKRPVSKGKTKVKTSTSPTSGNGNARELQPNQIPHKDAGKPNIHFMPWNSDGLTNTSETTGVKPSANKPTVVKATWNTNRPSVTVNGKKFTGAAGGVSFSSGTRRSANLKDLQAQLDQEFGKGKYKVQ